MPPSSSPHRRRGRGFEGGERRGTRLAFNGGGGRPDWTPAPAPKGESGGGRQGEGGRAVLALGRGVCFKALGLDPGSLDGRHRAHHVRDL